MAEMRKFLGYAREYEARRQFELADAAGAIAANKTAAAIRIAEKRPQLRLAA